MKKLLLIILLKLMLLCRVLLGWFNEFLNENFDRDKMNKLANDKNYRKKILGNLWINSAKFVSLFTFFSRSMKLFFVIILILNLFNLEYLIDKEIISYIYFCFFLCFFITFFFLLIHIYIYFKLIKKRK
jgi:hypothetical protein